MKRSTLLYCLLLACCAGCTKTIDSIIEKATAPEKNSFIQYRIKKGEHSVANNSFKIIETTELKFVVKFDSTAIYQSLTGENQYDINKLYGFSDNNAQHHLYSARFGWSWNENALRLYAYVYNNGTVVKQEIGTANINTETLCSIKVSGNAYVFTLNNTSLSIPRLSTTPAAEGYLLYPYFGGDEVAPHDVNIWIKNL